jgi:hypothetical protein
VRVPGAKSTSKEHPASETWNRPARKSIFRRPFSAYSIDTAKRLVTVRFAETLTFDDIEDYAIALRADRRFDPNFSELVDLRDVEEVVLSARQMLSLADQVDPFTLRSKRAFVVRSQGQINAAHMHCILRPESKNIRVFFSIDEAEQWIEHSGPDR